MTATNSSSIQETSDQGQPADVAAPQQPHPPQAESTPTQPTPQQSAEHPQTQQQHDTPAAEPQPVGEPVITPGIQPTVSHKDPEPTPPPAAPKPDNNRPTRIIALMNQKGGVGKTTTCTNLGAALARMGQRVLMIDLDPQAHLTLSLGVDPDAIEKSMYDLLTDPTTTAQEVVQPIGEDGQLQILPAEVNLAGVEAELADKVVTGMAQTVLKQKVAPFLSGTGYRVSGLGRGQEQDPKPEARSPKPDYILIDCPPSLGLLTVNALTLASEVIVPMQAHFLALQGLGKLFETIMMMKQGINPSLSVAGVVLCMHEGNTILANEVINDVNGFLEAARGTDAPWADAVVYNPPIRRNIKLAESPSFGQSIFDYAPDCHGAQDYAKLAESVIGQRVNQ